MNLEFFENILLQVKDYTKVIAFHIFGDPLTLSNLEEYLDLTDKYGLKVEITTTGFFLKNFDLELFLHPAIRQINFSLNSYNKNEMKISLEQFMAPILKLCDLKIEKKHHHFINFRLWNLDEKESEKYFNNKVFSILEKHFQIELYGENISKFNKGLRLENQILLHFDTYFEWPNLTTTHISDHFCHGLSSHFGILSDGGVVPCCLDGFGVINLGNLHHTTLKKILTNERSTQIREKFKQNIAIEELCKRCTYKEKFSIL